MEFLSNDYWTRLLSKTEIGAGKNPVGLLPILMSFHQMPVISHIYFFRCCYVLCSGMRSKSKATATENSHAERRGLKKIYRATEQKSATGEKQQQNAERRKWQIKWQWRTEKYYTNSVHQIDLWKLIIIIIIFIRKWMYISLKIQRLNHY